MKKRRMMQIPEDTDTFKYLFDGENRKDKAKWEFVEELIKQIPKSKQERAKKIFNSFVEEMTILYPGSDEALEKLWPLIAKRIMKLPELTETGYGSEFNLSDSYFEDLKKL